MTTADAITTVEIVSRSGRARATLASLLMDDEERTAEAIAAATAATAYSPLSDADRHAALAAACLAAIVTCEGMPGEAHAETMLEDGRRIVATRRIG